MNKRTLILYGSIREGADSKVLASTARKELVRLGSEAVLYDPAGLPMFDYTSFNHPKTVELHNLALWADSYVWCSPEYHGGPSGVIKNVIDWLPARDRSAGATEGKPVALMSTTGGAQSFNTINALTINARWLKMPVVATHVNWAKPYNGLEVDVMNRVAKAVQEIINYTI